MHLLHRSDRWVWFNLAAVIWSALLVVLACTVHDRGSASDPDMLFHSYTLVQDVGPVILILVAAPLAISLVLARVLYLKTTRRSFRAERAAWWVASLGLLTCLPGLIVQGLWVLPAPVLIVAAAATAPLGARE
jgi:hypothetical protein